MSTPKWRHSVEAVYRRYVRTGGDNRADMALIRQLVCERFEEKDLYISDLDIVMWPISPEDIEKFVSRTIMVTYVNLLPHVTIWAMKVVVAVEDMSNADLAVHKLQCVTSKWASLRIERSLVTEILAG